MKWKIELREAGEWRHIDGHDDFECACYIASAYTHLHPEDSLRLTRNEKMKIAIFICCYNEIEYLPKVLEYYKRHNIDVFVADNYSTDGTWEWLEENDIDRYQFDTGEMFSVIFQQSLRQKFAEEHPEYDWIIYGDADELIIAKYGLLQMIEDADKANKNVIRSHAIELHNTGEWRRGDPYDTYFFYDIKYPDTGVERIFKNVDNVQYNGDFIFPEEGKEIHQESGSYCLNYGNTKTIRQRERVYRRRKRAWDAGIEPEDHGSHYRLNRETNFMRDREDLDDLREHPDWEFIHEKIKGTSL